MLLRMLCAAVVGGLVIAASPGTVSAEVLDENQAAKHGAWLKGGTKPHSSNDNTQQKKSAAEHGATLKNGDAGSSSGGQLLKKANHLWSNTSPDDVPSQEKEPVKEEPSENGSSPEETEQPGQPEPEKPESPQPMGCDGHCGSESPDGCWCDSECFDFGDCCDNICLHCPDQDLSGEICNDGSELEHSCEERCGQQAPGGCWCDEQCSGYGDCCEDLCIWCDDSSCVACIGDINNDGVVNTSDLLALLASWGPCDGCPADLNGDGVVNVSDHLILLSNWGPCPE